MSLTKHYTPLMIPLAHHEEPTHPEFHCYPASEVDALSQDCAVLRQEIKDNEEELAKTQGALDEARKEIKRLEGALRGILDSATSVPAPYIGNAMDPVNDLRIVSGRKIDAARSALAAADGQQEELYYLQCTEGVVGNSALFWREGGCGYTCDLNQAGLFYKDRAFSQHRCRSIDVPRLKSEMDAIAQRHVHVDQMPRPSGTGDGVEGDFKLCEDCPPQGYPTDRTRCSACPRSQ